MATRARELEESDIKREVIIEFRGLSKHLLENNVRTMKALIEAQEALLVYRKGSLQQMENMLSHFGSTGCVPGCDKHTWDTKDGWHKGSPVNGAT